MAFRSRAKLFVERKSFLDKFRNKKQQQSQPDKCVMILKTKSGDFKELNSNGDVINKPPSNKSIKEPRKHSQV